MNLAALLAAFAANALASDMSLPAWPLAVKTPYLSTWLPYNGSASVPSATPMFWRGQSLTWQIMARINNDAYCLFGCANSSLTLAKQTGLSFTSTHTLINLEAGTAQFELDFFSPVSLTDYTRQSIPYSYLSVTITRTPLLATVDILTAIDDTWTSQQPSTQANFTRSAGGSSIFSLSGTNSYTWAENSDMAAWGDVLLAANSKAGGFGSSITQQIGSQNVIATQFEKHGTLTGTVSGYTSGDLVALAYHLRPTLSTALEGSTVTFAVGLEQDNALNWLGAPQTGYYQATISGTCNVMDHFFSDEAAAKSESKNLDEKIERIGNQISSNYSDLLQQSTRQTWGGFQVLIPMDTKNTSLAKAWMKEISTDGNVNTVADLVPKAFPVFYVLAPDYMRLLLEPMMEYALTWPAEFAFHDLGKHYPNATGETVATEEPLIVDQTSVLEWMTYAYQKASGNTEWIKPYIPVLQKYTNYLAANGLYTASQRSSVDSIGGTANQTVLAMYSAVALTSFGAMTGQENYTALGKHFADVVLELGTGTSHTHITANFGANDSSWISTYPLAWDQMTQLGTFNTSTAAMQSKWYEGELYTYGMPFFSGVDYATGDFMSWTAATSSEYVRDALINGAHALLSDRLNDVAGPTNWFVLGPQAGIWTLSQAKSSVGSYFMPTAVNTHY